MLLLGAAESGVVSPWGVSEGTFVLIEVPFAASAPLPLPLGAFSAGGVAVETSAEDILKM